MKRACLPALHSAASPELFPPYLAYAPRRRMPAVHVVTQQPSMIVNISQRTTAPPTERSSANIPPR